MRLSTANVGICGGRWRALVLFLGLWVPHGLSSTCMATPACGCDRHVYVKVSTNKTRRLMCLVLGSIVPG